MATTECKYMLIWRSAVGEHLGKKYLCAKYLPEIICSVLAVEAGIKPSYLVDFACIDVQKVKNFVNCLLHQDIVRSDLFVVTVGQDIFIINRTGLLKHVTNILHKLERFTSKHCGLYFQPMFVDVSECYETPVFASETTSAEIQEQLKDITLVLQNKCHSSDVLIMNFGSEVNLSTVYGIFLGYPHVYWYSKNSSSNCLSMTPLVIYKLYTKLSSSYFSAGSCMLKKSYCISSFSIPQCLDTECKADVEVWEESLKNSLQHQTLFSEMHLEKTVQMLSFVTM